MRISDWSSDVCSSDLWLPGHCSCPAFPDDIQWHEGPELAGHSCGGSAGSRTRVHFRLPFSSPFGEPVAARLIVPGALNRKPMNNASVAAEEQIGRANGGNPVNNAHII